jgi:peptide/nickel transport system substrate-binding protein
MIRALTLTFALALAAFGLLPRVDAQGGPAVTIAINGNVNTLDPHNTATIGTDLSVVSHLYTALLVRGPDLKLQPQLATAWRTVDELTWRFTLRSGAAFANGEPLDAAAVKWNIDRVRDPKVNARIRSWFELVADVTVLSPTEIEIKTKQPYPALADQLSMFFLLPPQWAASNNPANAVMGSGPYEVRQIVPGDRIVLQARANYWGERPTFETVTFRVVPDASSRVAAVMAGEVDLVTGVPPSEIKRIGDSGRARAGSVDSHRAVFLKLNNLVAPLKDNLKFRQALNYAIDKEGIRDAIMAGLPSLSNCQVLSPDYVGYNPGLKPYPYDPAKARQLLRESGVPLGSTTLDLEVPLGVYLLAQEVAQAAAAQLEEIGVKTRIVEMEFGAFMNKYLRAQNMGQISYLTQAWPTLDADGLLTLFEAGNQYAYWNDQPFADLIRQARSTTDLEKRRQLYAQATERMCDQAPVIFLFNQPVTYGLSNRIDWKARGDDWVRAADMKAQ